MRCCSLCLSHSARLEVFFNTQLHSRQLVGLIRFYSGLFCSVCQCFVHSAFVICQGIVNCIFTRPDATATQWKEVIQFHTAATDYFTGKISIAPIDHVLEDGVLGRVWMLREVWEVRHRVRLHFLHGQTQRLGH